jgi:hypothetical protein
MTRTICRCVVLALILCVSRVEAAPKIMLVACASEAQPADPSLVIVRANCTPRLGDAEALIENGFIRPDRYRAEDGQWHQGLVATLQLWGYDYGDLVLGDGSIFRAGPRIWRVVTVQMDFLIVEQIGEQDAQGKSFVPRTKTLHHGNVVQFGDLRFGVGSSGWSTIDLVPLSGQPKIVVGLDTKIALDEHIWRVAHMPGWFTNNRDVVLEEILPDQLPK